LQPLQAITIIACRGLHNKQQVFCHELECKSHFGYPVLVIPSIQMIQMMR